MTFDEVLQILRENKVEFEFVESWDDCHIFHIYLNTEDGEKDDGD
tara:strand:- start:788 stop:922 length:135 start_codon:yes stop_codon:yes gene_type:complete